MSEDDKGALKEFLQGAGIVVFVVSIFIIGIAIMSGGSVPDDEQSTKVVGTYKDCDIIQWHYSALAEYKYFLYCENK